MIVLIGSQKGGVGKSTKAVNIAGYLILKQGKTAIIVDADDQKSIMTGTTTARTSKGCRTFRWWQRRAKSRKRCWNWIAITTT